MNQTIYPCFPEGKKKAVTLSFDDGVIQDIPLVALLNNYGMKGTFNISCGKFEQCQTIEADGMVFEHKVISREQAAGLYSGHEIGNHTWSHIALGNMPSNVQMYEISNNQHMLETLVHSMIRGLAYPYGSYNKDTFEILRLSGCIYGRTTVDTKKFDLPGDFYQWHPTCHFAAPELLNLADIFLKEERPWYMPWQVFHIWGHSYELDCLNLWGQFETFIQLISRRKEIWYISNGELAAYVQAAEKLELYDDGKRLYNPTPVTVWGIYGERPFCAAPGQWTDVG